MKILNEFLAQYGMTILYTIVTTFAGYIGIVVKNVYVKYMKDKTKRAVAKTVVKAIEQIGRDLSGEEKFAKVKENIIEMLNEKGITITSLELEMLIEAAVSEFNIGRGEELEDE
jgi:Phage holin protein (Holin_LLH).